MVIAMEILNVILLFDDAMCRENWVIRWNNYKILS